MGNQSSVDAAVAFRSQLGWMAMRVHEHAICRLTFGHPSSAVAIQALGSDLPPSRKLLAWQSELVDLLQLYAQGAPIDFSATPIEIHATTDFRTLVLSKCRKIPYGQTATYGELARRAGAPGAARAVGTCMRRNPLPLIIPCHRVTRAGGVIGPYSGAEGTKTKRRLLEMESAGQLVGVLG